MLNTKSMILGAVMAVTLVVGSGSVATASGPVQMLPPVNFDGTNKTACAPGTTAGLLYWDGSTAIKCIPGSSGNASGDVAVGGNVSARGSIKAGYDSVCAAADAGKIRYNPNISIFEGCDGTQWSVLGPPHAFGGMYTWDNWLGCEIGNVFAGGRCGCPAWAPNDVVGYTAMQGFIYYFIFVNDLHYCYSNASSGGTGGGSTVGMCGGANGVPSATVPSANLCRSGTPTAVGTSGSNWVWRCMGSTSTASDSCSAPNTGLGGGGGDGSGSQR